MAFARGHLHRIDVIGGQRHQVAGAARLEEARALQRQALVQLRAQLDTHAEGRRKELQAPRHPQAVDGHAGGQQQAHFAQQRIAVQLARHERVDHAAHLARQPDDEQRDAEQHHARRGIGAPMAEHEATDEVGEGHGDQGPVPGLFGRGTAWAAPARRRRILGCMEPDDDPRIRRNRHVDPAADPGGWPPPWPSIVLHKEANQDLGLARPRRFSAKASCSGASIRSCTELPRPCDHFCNWGDALHSVPLLHGMTEAGRPLSACAAAAPPGIQAVPSHAVAAGGCPA
jgi:hypothetical protein